MRAPPLVILDGPDGSGKSRLAEGLSKSVYPGAWCEHDGGRPVGDPKSHYMLGLFRALAHLHRGEAVVLDRFARGERVYGPVLRGHDALGGGWNDIRDVLEMIPAVEVICLPPYAECYKAWSSRPSREYIKDEALFEASYRAWTREAWSSSVFIYDWTDPESFDNLYLLIESSRRS